MSYDRIYAVAFAILCVTTSAVSGADWKEMNGGLPTAIAGAGGLAVDPRNPTTLYSWTRQPGNRGLLTSTDGGASWKIVNGVTDVEWLVVDPKRSETLYVGAGYGVLKSVNRGESWTGLNEAPRWLSPVVIDPTEPDTLYAVSSSVVKSTDGGASWRRSNAGLSGPPYPRFLAMDPLTPSTLYVTAENGGVYKSFDKGENWFVLKPGAPNTGGGNLAMAIDPENPAIMYAGSFAAAAGPPAAGARPYWGEGTISKSTDGGQSWNIIRAGIPANARVLSFVIDPASPSNVYANFEGFGIGIIKSTDRGESWSTLEPGIPPGSFAASPVVIDPQSPSTLYFGYVDRSGIGVGGVSKSTNGGATWSPANAGRTFLDVRALAIHPDKAGVVYAAAGAAGLFQSVDAGENWTRVVAFQLPAVSFNPQAPGPVFPAGAAAIRSLVIARPGTLYVLIGRVSGCHATDRVLLKSIDGGESWTDAGPPLGGCSFWNFGNPVPMALDPTDPNTLYVGADFGDINGENPALLKTNDGGASWSSPLARGCCAVNALAGDPRSSGTFYGGTGSGVLKSVDGGATWNSTGLGTGVSVIALDPVNSSILYAASDTGYSRFGGLFKSTDSGTSWRAINNGLDRLVDTHAPVTTLVVDPTRPEIVYAGTAGYGVFRSTDGGGNWKQLNDGLMSLDIRVLTLASGSNTLYAVTSTGVFALRAAGESN